MKLPATFAIAAALIAILCAAPSNAAPYAETFSAAAVGSAFPAGWNIPAADFTLVPGALVSNGNGAKSFAVWNTVPAGNSVTYTATITAVEAPGKGWDAAGIGIWVDNDNYWQLALIQPPAEMTNLKNFTELAEMYNKEWNSQGAGAKALTALPVSSGFEWKPGVPYQFKLVVSPDQILGTISDAGVVKAQRGFKFNNPAVTKGKPVLISGGFKARFTDVKAEVAP
ncbi:MAG TPA: hypothetical protein VGK19_03530 [Capsulimonadaceae bacterium]|jgi:hypothetical protein